MVPLVGGHQVDSGCRRLGHLSDDVQQLLVTLVHLVDVFWIFGDLHHQRLQPGPQGGDPARHLMRNLQLDPGEHGKGGFNISRTHLYFLVGVKPGGTSGLQILVNGPKLVPSL